MRVVGPGREGPAALRVRVIRRGSRQVPGRVRVVRRGGR